nr:wd repeat-containing protein 26 [Quercus suber]
MDQAPVARVTSSLGGRDHRPGASTGPVSFNSEHIGSGGATAAVSCDPGEFGARAAPLLIPGAASLVGRWRALTISTHISYRKVSLQVPAARCAYDWLYRPEGEQSHVAGTVLAESSRAGTLLVAASNLPGRQSTDVFVKNRHFSFLKLCRASARHSSAIAHPALAGLPRCAAPRPAPRPLAFSNPATPSQASESTAQPHLDQPESVTLPATSAQLSSTQPVNRSQLSDRDNRERSHKRRRPTSIDFTSPERSSKRPRAASSSQNGVGWASMRLDGTNGQRSVSVSNESQSHFTNGETNGYHRNGHGDKKLASFHGHDREEVTRILLQSLSDLGYRQAAVHLSNESGCELEIPSVAAFRSAVQNGNWEEAEVLLLGSSITTSEGGVLLGNGDVSSSGKSRHTSGSTNGYHSRGLPLAQGADRTMLKFLLRQQKYLELLERRDLNAALMVLRNELQPLRRDTLRLHTLSSLMMCQSAKDLKSNAGWDGAGGESRTILLSEISRSISPSVMIPEHRLATLFTAVQEEQILNCRYHNTVIQPSLYVDHDCSPDDFPLQTLTELKHHSDEVWYLEFSADGSMLATAGKDGLVCVYDTASWRIRHEFREHERTAAASENSRGICFVGFSPDSKYLISCSQNNEFVVVNVQDGRRVATADHFDYPVTSAAWLPDSETFVVGTQSSRRPLGLYSLRSPSSSSSGSVVRNNEIHSWRDPPWDATSKDNPLSFRVTDCAVSVDGRRMAATTLNHQILLFDMQTREKIADWAMDDKLTCINFSADGAELLVNMNEGQLVALDSVTGETTMRYEGVKQVEFVIRSRYGGAGENFVISGSEGVSRTKANT